MDLEKEAERFRRSTGAEIPPGWPRRSGLTLLLAAVGLLQGCRDSTEGPDEPRWVIVEAASTAISKEGTLVESVGLETLGGVFTPLLEAGSTVTSEASRTFSTATDDQEELSIALYRGKSDSVRDNHFLGRFMITGFALAPAGIPLLEVQFAARDGSLWILARDSRTGAGLRVERER